MVFRVGEDSLLGGERLLWKFVIFSWCFIYFGMSLLYNFGYFLILVFLFVGGSKRRFYIKNSNEYFLKFFFLI